MANGGGMPLNHSKVHISKYLNKKLRHNRITVCLQKMHAFFLRMYIFFLRMYVEFRNDQWAKGR